MKQPRKKIRRVSFNVKPQDLWVGVYIGPEEYPLYDGDDIERRIYICPLPMLCITWRVRHDDSRGRSRLWLFMYRHMN
jgi:hypothetical protein